MDLEFGRTLSELKAVDVVPLHDKYDLPEARLIAAGQPERSVLLHRMMLRGRGQMPQFGSAIPDERAVEFIRQWITSLGDQVTGQNGINVRN
jgi:hypothetical protein